VPPLSSETQYRRYGACEHRTPPGRKTSLPYGPMPGPTYQLLPPHILAPRGHFLRTSVTAVHGQEQGLEWIAFGSSKLKIIEPAIPLNNIANFSVIMYQRVMVPVVLQRNVTFRESPYMVNKGCFTTARNSYGTPDSHAGTVTVKSPGDVIFCIDVDCHAPLRSFTSRPLRERYSNPTSTLWASPKARSDPSSFTLLD